MTLLLRVRRAFCALHLLLGEAFTQPVLENGAFRKSYVQTERHGSQEAGVHRQ